MGTVSKCAAPFTEAELAAEQWRDVPGCEGYQVSDLGRVGSFRLTGTGSKLRATRKIVAGRRAGEYRSVWVGPPKKLRSRLVHQLILEVFVGPRPPGMWALHRNDVRDDNRLSNLYYGTPAQNSQDSIRNETFRLGSKHHNAKLTEDDIPEIFKLHREGFRNAAIASHFGVTDVAISCVLTGKTWTHVGKAYIEIPRRPTSKRHRISDAEVIEVRSLYAQGLSYVEIARRFGVTGSAISAIVNGKRRARAGGAGVVE